jgi:hypothetical protein
MLQAPEQSQQTAICKDVDERREGIGRKGRRNDRR